MHRCMRCSRILEKIGEIEQGCSCGSKVFMYSKTGPSILNQEQEEESKKLERDITVELDLRNISNSLMLEVENVRMLEKGVFKVDLKSLLKDPLVLKDTNGVYYIKLD